MSRSARHIKAEVRHSGGPHSAPPGGARDPDRTITMLSQRLKEQVQENDRQVDAVNALQRNFQGISTLLGQEKEAHEQLRAKYEELKRLRDDSKGQLKLNAVVRVEFERLQAEYREYREAMEQQVADQLCRCREAEDDRRAAQEELLTAQAQHAVELEAKDQAIAGSVARHEEAAALAGALQKELEDCTAAHLASQDADGHAIRTLQAEVDRLRQLQARNPQAATG